MWRFLKRADGAFRTAGGAHSPGPAAPAVGRGHPPPPGPASRSLLAGERPSAPDALVQCAPAAARPLAPRRRAHDARDPCVGAGDVAPDQVTRWWVGRGRGRRPRRPASPRVFPRTSPLTSPLASPLARRAGDVAPYHGVWWWGMVGADVPGGPRLRGRPRRCPLWRLRARGAPGTSRPTRCARWWGMVGADVLGDPRPRGRPRRCPRWRGAVGFGRLAA